MKVQGGEVRSIIIATAAAAAVFVAGAGPSRAADDASGCNLERTELHPADVVQPCTTFLAAKNLSPAERAEALFIRGRAYHRTNRLDLALQDYDAALKLEPDTAETVRERANVELRQRRFNAYQRDVERAVAIAPHNHRVLLTQAQFYRNSGRMAKAFELFAQAVNDEPDDPMARLLRIDAYKFVRDYPKALADADAAVRATAPPVKPRGYLDDEGNVRSMRVIALTVRAGLLEDMGEFKRAARDYDAAVAIDKSARSLIWRAQFNMTKPGKLAAAEADAREAVKREPLNGSAYYALGSVLFTAQKYTEAFHAFNAAVRARPDDGYALFMRARVDRHFGRTDDAVRDLKSAIAADPLNVLPRTMASLRAAGYWNKPGLPTHMTPPLDDAIRACMIDTRCN